MATDVYDCARIALTVVSFFEFSYTLHVGVPSFVLT